MPDNFYEKIKPRLYRRIGCELRLAGRILDLGCGCCDLVSYLVNTYHQAVTGVDISSASFPKNRTRGSSGKMRCIRKDARRLTFAKGRSMDAVVIMWALHEMLHPNEILKEAHRVLRPGGEMLIVDFPHGSLAQRLWGENYYTPAEVRDKLIRAGLHDVSVRLIEREQIMWARGHRAEENVRPRNDE